MEDEIYKPIRGYDGRYEISNFGNIISYAHSKSGKLMKGYKRKTGDLVVTLTHYNDPWTFLIRRLVTDTFIRRIKDNECVIQVDGDFNNLSVNNLKIVDKKYHNRDFLIKNKGENNANAKLSRVDVINIKKMIKNNTNIKDISKKYNVGYHCIRDIKNGKNCSHVKINEQYKN